MKSDLVKQIIELTGREDKFDYLCDQSETYLKKYLTVVKML